MIAGRNGISIRVISTGIIDISDKSEDGSTNNIGHKSEIS